MTDPSSAGPPPPDAAPPASPAAPAADAHAAITRLRAEVAKVIVGQEGTVSGIVVALLVRGHVLLEGVPGTAKTLLVKTVAAALDLETRRVQFTPDLMPSDLTGQVVYRQADATFMFRQGPVFTNLLLADEVNRTPPKTQAALLEAMEERQVSVEGTTHPLPDPFLVIATQNPVEYEGTYPLPGGAARPLPVQARRRLPDAAEELDVLARHDRGLDPHDIVGAGVRPWPAPPTWRSPARPSMQLRAEQPVLEYIVAVVRATRESPSLSLGVSPRGATALLHAAKAWAWLSGRDYVTPDEVKAVAKPTLRHRLMVRPELELEGVTPDGVLDGILATVPVPR